MRKTEPLLLAVLFSFSAGAAEAPRARPSPSPDLAIRLIERRDWQTRGKTLEARIELSVVRGSAVRRLELLLWAKGSEKAVVKVLSPKKERASARLRIGADLWSYSPEVERVQSVAPSMMKLAWMGGDFTNGDLIRDANLSRHYDHRIAGRENRDGIDVYVVESRARAGAPVETGKIITWLTPDDAVQIRQELFGTDGRLQHTVVSKEYRKSGGHHFAAKFVVLPAGKPGDYTEVEYRSFRFDRPIPDSTFTQEFLKKRLD